MTFPGTDTHDLKGQKSGWPGWLSRQLDETDEMEGPPPQEASSSDFTRRILTITLGKEVQCVGKTLNAGNGNPRKEKECPIKYFSSTCGDYTKTNARCIRRIKFQLSCYIKIKRPLKQRGYLKWLLIIIRVCVNHRPKAREASDWAHRFKGTNVPLQSTQRQRSTRGSRSPGSPQGELLPLPVFALGGNELPDMEFIKL